MKDKEVALTVMGWDWGKDFTDFYTWCDTWCDNQSMVKGKFKPYTNISDAWLVEERIIELKLAKEYVDALIAIVSDDNDTDPANLTQMLIVHATPRQRCKAALEAIEERRRDE